jgi:heparan-alpha-glucosaminide N-acetyltransferase
MRSRRWYRETHYPGARDTDGNIVPLTRAPMDFAQVAFLDDRPTCTNISVAAIDTNCMGCLLQQLATNSSSCFIGVTYITARFPVNFDVNGIGGSYFFGDRGVYEVVVTSAGLVTVAELQAPLNPAVPLCIAAAILLALNFAVRGGIWLWERRERGRAGPSLAAATTPSSASEGHSLQMLPTPEGQQLLSVKSSSSAESPPAVFVRGKVRYVCLDVFRGLSLTVMIFVNYGGGGYWFLDHSAWNGLTVADLVFPWFIFMMGASAAVVLTSAAKKHTPKLTVVTNALRRGATLFAYGLLIAAGNKDGSSTQFSTLRIPGVLQRFGASYVAVVLIVYCLPCGDRPEEKEDQIGVDDQPAGASSILAKAAASGRKALREDFSPFRWQWAVVGGLALLWIFITFAIPFPGCPAAYVGPGGISDGGAHANCTGGVAAYIDYKFFGADHIYDDGTFVGPYQTTVFHDPEGLLGTLNSIVLCYLGAAAGRVLLRCPTHTSPKAMMLRLGVYGTALCFAAACLCGFSQNSGPIPVNKNLWSTSFVLLLSGFGMWTLAGLYLVIDFKQLWDGKPFLFLGLNSILVYMFSEILPPQTTLYVSEITHAWLLFRNLLSVGIYTVFAYWLHWHKWYFAV